MRLFAEKSDPSKLRLLVRSIMLEAVTRNSGCLMNDNLLAVIRE